MDNNFHLPRTGDPLADTVIAVIVGVGLGLMVVGFAGYIIWGKSEPFLQRIAHNSEVTKEEVKNTHSTNLRHDIDNLTAGIKRLEDSMSHSERMINLLAKDIGGMKEELRNDRESARELGEKLDAHIRDNQGLEPRISALEHNVQAHRKVTETP